MLVLFATIVGSSAQIASAQVTTLLEGGENGLGGVTAQISTGYEVLSSRTFADGPPHAFHFAHPDASNQWMRINKQVHPQAGTVLNFKSRLGWAGVGQTAHVQVSADGGSVWTDIYTQTGTDAAGESTFHDRSVGLGAYAGRTIDFRFLYTRNSDLTTFSGTSDSGFYIIGWFVDLIEVVNPGASVPEVSEGGENGVENVTIQTSPGYVSLSTNTYADGPHHSFHLAHPDFADQSVRLNASVIPQTNSILNFKSRMAWAGEGQVAHAQVSANSGASWIDVYAQSGTNAAGESGFTDHSVNLGAFAGQTIQIRFLYSRNAAMTTYSGVADSGQFILGWFIDVIAVTNVVISGGGELPLITQGPQSQMAVEGDSVGFSVTATGTGSLSYQWQQNGVPIVGGTSPVLNLSSVGASEAGSYVVTVRNSAGSTSSNPAALSVFSITSPALTDQSSVTVSGAVMNASNVAGITVNGVTAQTSDGFSHWTVPNVALAEGRNTFLISAVTNAPGNWTNVSAKEIYRATQSNLLAFAFNSSGPSHSSDDVPRTTIERDVQTGKNRMIVSYRRRIDPIGLAYLVEMSEDMQTWRTAGIADVETLQSGSPNPDGVTETIVVKVLRDIADGDQSRCFVRVRVAL